MTHLTFGVAAIALLSKLFYRKSHFVFGLFISQALLASTASQAHEQHLIDPKVILVNGDFSEGSGLPSHWLYQPRPEVTSQLKLVNDVTHDVPTGAADFKAQALRLTLEAVEPKTSADEVSVVSVTQILRRKPQGAFNLSGWIKSSPSVQAKVMLRAKNADWTQDVVSLDLTANAFAPDAQGWRYFFASVTLPATATTTLVSLEGKGVGSCWLDNMEAAEAPVS